MSSARDTQEPSALTSTLAAAAGGLFVGALAAFGVNQLLVAWNRPGKVKLHCDPRSTCSRKCLLALAETGIPFELQKVLLDKKQHKTAAHIALHPFGKVPALVVDNKVVFEALAITDLIAAMGSQSGVVLVPVDKTQAALVRQWVSVAKDYFKPAMKGMYFERILKKRYGRGPADEAKVRESVNATSVVLDIVEKALSANASTMGLVVGGDGQKSRGDGDIFLVGHSFTLADLYFIPELHIVEQIAPKLLHESGARPHVVAWWLGLRERSSWKENVVKWDNPESM